VIRPAPPRRRGAPRAAGRDPAAPAAASSGRRTRPGSAYPRLYAVIRRIPRGRVATYGQVAVLAGLPGRARQVGYALHALPEGSPVPWHRVINARGEVSLRAEPGWEGYQRFLLEEEGVAFDLAGRVDLDRFLWQPDDRPTRRGRR
jgi:methylated-DNA-protein-cysteine methyltransferase-like protein